MIAARRGCGPRASASFARGMMTSDVAVFVYLLFVVFYVFVFIVHREWLHHSFTLGSGC